MRHYVPTLDALLDPKKLLPPMFAGEVDGLFEELLFHEWQVDFHAQSALQTGFDKEKIAAASAARNRRISRTRAYFIEQFGDRRSRKRFFIRRKARWRAIGCVNHMSAEKKDLTRCDVFLLVNGDSWGLF